MIVSLLYRVGYTLRTSPWVRLSVGALLLTAGVLELFFGAGHGGLIAVGLLVLVGAATALRGGNARPVRDPEVEPPVTDRRSREPGRAD